MTREQLLARLEGLRLGLADLEAKCAAQRGAIAECEYWLNRLTEDEQDSSWVPDVPPIRFEGETLP